jgi:uncharacterized protein (DUF58 family)
VKGILKLFYYVYRFFSGLKYRARRRLTRPGLVVLGSLLVVAMTGLDPEISAAYQAFSLLLSLLLVSFVFTWSFRARFSAQRGLPRFGTVGCPLHYRVRVVNLTTSTQSGLTLIEDLADPRPSFPDWLAVQAADGKHVRSFQLSQRRPSNRFRQATFKDAEVPVVPPDQATEVRVEFTPLRRGILRFEGVTLARPDPLGLMRALVTVRLPQTLLVLPRRYPVPRLALPGTQKYQEGGVAFASSVGHSEEFMALRDYRHGDPLRHIHWRTWARAGRPVVKEFQDEFFVRHALVLDTFTDDPHSEVFEEAVSVAASFVCTIQTQESLLDLLFVVPHSYCLTAGRGLAHADQMLEILASVRPCPDQPFVALERLVLNHVRTLSGCICVLVGWDEDRRRFVQQLRGLGVPVLVVVIMGSGDNRVLDPGPLQDQPERFHVIQAGQVERGLARLN